MDTLREWLAAARKGEGSPDAELRLRAVESAMSFRLPDPVRFLLTTADRPEGSVGDSYIAFFAVDDLAQCCADVRSAAPGFIPFASNGAGEWYGIDARLNTPAFVLLPAIGAEWSAAMFLGSGWDEFWKTLQRGDLFEHPYQASY
jgi:hypothetical protein